MHPVVEDEEGQPEDGEGVLGPQLAVAHVDVELLGEAADGQHGLALMLDHKPEVVLVDLGLPGMDGFDLARAVRESPLGQTTLLIAVTGYGQTEDRRRSKEVGFDAHLVKPVSQSLLAALISTP